MRFEMDGETGHGDGGVLSKVVERFQRSMPGCLIADAVITQETTTENQPDSVEIAEELPADDIEARNIFDDQG